MSEHSRAALAPLPLLLWRTPPGLELILSQEGIAHEVIRDTHPFALRRGRFVLFDGGLAEAKKITPLLTQHHVLIDVDLLRQDEPVDPLQAMVDHHASRLLWRIHRFTLAERASRHPKAWIRRRLIDKLRALVLARGGVWIRLAPFPYPYRSAFNFRVDLDEPIPEDYHRFSLPRNLLADCCTHFVSTHAYQNEPEVLADLGRYDTNSHGHFHYVYRDPEANYRNLERAHGILRDAGIEPVGFAAPHGRWNPGLDDAIESLGYVYSSDFQLGYDDFPFYPWKGHCFSSVLQFPVHPVCEGLFLDAGVQEGRIVADYLSRVVEAKIKAGEPALIYGHPERRLGKMPEILIALHRRLQRHSLVWRVTLTELARWWRWRTDRKFVVLPREGDRFEVQFEEWDTEFPLALEIQRGCFCASLPVQGSRTVIKIDELVYQRREPPDGPLAQPPHLDLRPPSLRDTVRQALDWETVTPIDELSSSSLAGRLKRGLRWWKLQKTGTG